MRITCPSCSAAYDVPDSLVTPGRIVRCARCGGEWTPVATAATRVAELAAPVEQPPEPVEPPPTWSTARQSAMDRLAAHPARPPSRLGLRLAWVASVAVLLLALCAAYAWRDRIAVVWPPSARAYALFGLHTHPQ